MTAEVLFLVQEMQQALTNGSMKSYVERRLKTVPNPYRERELMAEAYRIINAKLETDAELRESVKESRKVALAEAGGSARSEMFNAVKKQFKGLMEPETLNEDFEIALYWFASEYHEGQNSDLYKILSTSHYRPGQLMHGVEDEGPQAEMIYEFLVEKYGGGSPEHGKPSPQMSPETRVQMDDEFEHDSLGEATKPVQKLLHSLEERKEALTEKHIGFKKLEGQLKRRGDVSDPGAVAYSIGVKKFGKAGMARKAAAGRHAANHMEDPSMDRKAELIETAAQHLEDMKNITDHAEMNAIIDEIESILNELRTEAELGRHDKKTSDRLRKMDFKVL